MRINFMKQALLIVCFSDNSKFYDSAHVAKLFTGLNLIEERPMFLNQEPF